MHRLGEVYSRFWDNMMEENYLARLYQSGSAVAQAVNIEIQGQQLFIVGSGQSFLLDDFTLEIGGHEQDRIKLINKSDGTTFVSEDKKFIHALSEINPELALAEKAKHVKSKIVSMPVAKRNYWLKIAAVVAAIVLTVYFSIDCFVGIAAANLDPKIEMKIGRWLVAKKDLDSESEMAERVKRIGKNLIAQLKNNKYHFKFYVKEDKTINASAYPGGVIIVNSGLLEQASDDEVAGVLGHEIGHVINRDTLKGMLHNAGIFVGLGFVSQIGDVEKIADSLQLAQKLDSLNFNRHQEAQADIIGLELAEKAHYKGEALITFFERIKKEGNMFDNQYLALISDHPMTDDRIAAIKSELKRLKTNSSN